MTRCQVHVHLRALERERKSFLIRQHLDALRVMLEEPWVDVALAGEVTASLARFGEAVTWQVHPLRVGETYLLLCDRGTRRGSAVRWRSRAEGGGARFTAECSAALDRAWRGLLSTVSTEGRALPPDFARGGFEAQDLVHTAHVDGASLGVAACAAWLSRVCDTALADDTAASAEVGSDGGLRPVTLLAEKLAALRERWPAVAKVVVAREQTLDGAPPPGITLVPCARLRDAFECFGLSCEGLTECSIEEHVRRVADFQFENNRPHGTATWRDISARAWATAEALAREEVERPHAERARAWAALFALHAGDDDSAREIASGLRDPGDPSMSAWLAVVAATAAIDRGQFDEAQAQAEGVVRDAHRLPRDLLWIEGHARGTLGRALLHDGRHAEAQAVLEKTVQWFVDRDLPWEAARTSKDLATCLRLTGDASEALPILTRAFQWLDATRSRREVSAKTRDFLMLEYGRCLLAVGRPDEALGAFEHVMRAQAQDQDYPRLGALRGLVVVNRRLGRVAEARDFLLRCLTVADMRSSADALGRVAATVAAEACVDSDIDALERSRKAWERHFPQHVDEAAMRVVLARQVY